MRKPPDLSQFGRFPVSGGTCLLALGATVAFWGNVDVSPLTMGIEVRKREVWRLVTACLLHGDLLHLAFNLYWVWVFGTAVEGVWGHRRTLGIFVLFALGSMGAEFAVLEGGIGLSGIGYGLFGLLWVLSARDRRFEGVVDARTVQLFVIWFFICVVGTVEGIMPVANVAHGVGALLGWLLGWAVVLGRGRRGSAEVAIAVVVGLSLLGATVWRPYVNWSERRGRDEAYVAYAALKGKRNAEAVRWGRDAVRMNPKDAGAWFNLGIAYERTGDERRAREAYGRAREIAPANEKFARAAGRGQE